MYAPELKFENDPKKKIKIEHIDTEKLRGDAIKLRTSKRYFELEIDDLIFKDGDEKVDILGYSSKIESDEKVFKILFTNDINDLIIKLKKPLHKMYDKTEWRINIPIAKSSIYIKNRKISSQIVPDDPSDGDQVTIAVKCECENRCGIEYFKKYIYAPLIRPVITYCNEPEIKIDLGNMYSGYSILYREFVELYGFKIYLRPWLETIIRKKLVQDVYVKFGFKEHKRNLNFLKRSPSISIIEPLLSNLFLFSLKVTFPGIDERQLTRYIKSIHVKYGDKAYNGAFIKLKSQWKCVGDSGLIILFKKEFLEDISYQKNDKEIELIMETSESYTNIKKNIKIGYWKTPNGDIMLEVGGNRTRIENGYKSIITDEWEKVNGFLREDCLQSHPKTHSDLRLKFTSCPDGFGKDRCLDADKIILPLWVEREKVVILQEK